MSTISTFRHYYSIRFLGSGSISSSWGKTIRGGLGTILRSLNCASGLKDCSDCPLKHSCAYCYLYETHIPADATIMKKYPNAPHPYIVEPPLNEKSSVQANDRFMFSIVLIGKAIHYFPAVFMAVKELGQAGIGRDRVRFEIDAVSDQNSKILFNAMTGDTLLKPEPLKFSLTVGEPKQARFSLDFITPLRLQVNGNISHSPSLKDIVSGLVRRVFLLNVFHGDGIEGRLDDIYMRTAETASLISKNFNWVSINRWSTRQERDIPLDGLLGKMVFDGDIGILEPLLKVGETLHIGKNAAFGHGRYTLSREVDNEKSS